MLFSHGPYYSWNPFVMSMVYKPTQVIQEDNLKKFEENKWTVFGPSPTSIGDVYCLCLWRIKQWASGQARRFKVIWAPIRTTLTLVTHKKTLMKGPKADHRNLSYLFPLRRLDWVRKWGIKKLYANIFYTFFHTKVSICD